MDETAGRTALGGEEGLSSLLSSSAIICGRIRGEVMLRGDFGAGGGTFLVGVAVSAADDETGMLDVRATSVGAVLQITPFLRIKQVLLGNNQFLPELRLSAVVIRWWRIGLLRCSGVGERGAVDGAVVERRLAIRNAHVWAVFAEGRVGDGERWRRWVRARRTGSRRICSAAGVDGSRWTGTMLALLLLLIRQLFVKTTSARSVLSKCVRRGTPRFIIVRLLCQYLKTTALIILKVFL